MRQNTYPKLLIKLRDECKEALEKKDPTILEPKSDSSSEALKWMKLIGVILNTL